MSIENNAPKEKHDAAKERTWMERFYGEVHAVRDEVQKKSAQVYKYAEHEVKELNLGGRDFFGVPETKRDKDGKTAKNPAAWNPFMM